MSPPVGSDHRGLAVLSVDECLRKIGETPVGRVGIRHNGEILILPVNHVLDGTTIVFSTTWGAKLATLTHGAAVAFEVDGFDATTRTGWSVLVSGVVEVIDESCDDLERFAGLSWLPASEMVWLRIRPHEISGRHLGAEAHVTTDRAGDSPAESDHGGLP